MKFKAAQVAYSMLALSKTFVAHSAGSITLVIAFGTLTYSDSLAVTQTQLVPNAGGCCHGMHAAGGLQLYTDSI